MTNGELISVLGGGCGVASVAAIYLWRSLIAAKQLHSDSQLKQAVNINLKESFAVLESQIKKLQELNQELHDDILTLTAQRDRANAKVAILDAEVIALRQAFSLVNAQHTYLQELIQFLQDAGNSGRTPPLPTFFCPIHLEPHNDIT